MVASAILGCAVLSIAQLAAAATASTASARAVSEATILAWQKIDQLRSLAFTFDAAGTPVTDLSSDTASQHPFGGTGLAASPAGALARDTGGYVDYLDLFGQSLGGAPGGGRLPIGSRYRRRWTIAPSGGNPDLLVVRVRVLEVGGDSELAGAVTLRTRRRP